MNDDNSEMWHPQYYPKSTTMNNEQIPEGVMQEMPKEIWYELRCLNALYLEVDASIADDVKRRVLAVVKSQYQKNKVLRDALEQIAFDETLFSHEPKDIAQQALKQAEL